MKRRRRERFALSLLVSLSLLAALFAALLAAGCRGVDILEPDLSESHPQIAAAVREAQAEVRRAPGSAAAWARLGDRYRAHMWDPEAASCYRRAAELEPERFLWPYMQAVCLEPRDAAGAAQTLERALRIDGGYAPAHVRYGRVLQRLGRPDEAEGHYLRALELDPRQPHAEFGLGRLALGRDAYAEARSHLERAARLAPDSAEIRHALAQACLAAGDRQGAERHAGVARSLPERDPMDDPRAARPVPPAGPSAHQAWALAAEKRGEPGQAETHYREAIRLHPRLPTTRYHYGNLLLRLGRTEEAERQLSAALRLKPMFPAARFLLGVVLEGQGRLEESARELEAVLAVNPDHAGARSALGSIRLRQQRWNEALPHLERAVELQPHRVELFLDLAEAYAEAGRYPDAIETVRRALELRPSAATPEIVERMRGYEAAAEVQTTVRAR